MATPFTTFPIPTTFAVAEWGLAVNCKDFGAIGNGVANDTAAIQAAIDYALANNRTVVYMPAGTYKTTAPLWLDPPGNMRVGYAGPYTIGAVPPGNFASPPDWHFTLTLTGEPGGSATEGDGTVLAPFLINEAAIYVGPGEDMRVTHLTIYGRYTGIIRGQQNPNCIAVAYCSNGANSRTETTHVYTYHFHTGFKTAANGNAGLGDSNTFYKCTTSNVYTALTIGATQNFMNTVYDCQFGDCTVCIDSRNGAGAHVFGGNMSGNGGAAAVFTIAMDAGSFASSGIGNYFHYDFTGVITAPDAFINTVYNGYCIKTAHFGIIPLYMFGFNTGTNRANFRIDDSWSEFHGFSFNFFTSSDLIAEIQACTSLYAAERKITFIGSGISCTGGVHVENAYAPTTILQSFETFGSNTNTWLTGLVFNVDPSGGDLSGSAPGTSGQAIWYNSQVWPFIYLQGPMQVTVSNCMMQMSNNPVLIQHDNQLARLVCKENSRFGPVVSRVSRQGGSDGQNMNANNTGGGEYDDTPFFAASGNNNAIPGDHWRRIGYSGNHPVWGWRPAQHSRPTIMSASLAQLAGTLPAISVSGGTVNVSYPLMWGGQIYNINDGTYTADVFDVVSNHHYYTYGQDLTTTNVPTLSWSHKEFSPCVYADANTLSAMFAGLGIKLNDGSVDRLYLVTGVYPGLGYFTAQQVTGPTGTTTTIYTGTTIKQEPFAIKVVNGPRTVVTKTGDFTVAPLDNNIIVNKAAATCTVTLPSASTYNGRAITIKTIQAFTVISASNNIVPQVGGGLTNAILPATAGKWALLTSNGTNWEIVQSG